VPIRITSLEDKNYNCIAWAAEEDDRWWWPTKDYYWPPGVTREETIEAFVLAYATIGYEACENAELEPGYQKIAIYVDSRGIPTHAARQLRKGEWASKMGTDCDIEHPTLQSIREWPGGRSYGSAKVYLRRPI
jgi:hypothetical protein